MYLRKRARKINKYGMLYSKLKRTHLTKLNDAIGLLQKPFDYSASFTKVKKTPVGGRKSNLLDKRMSVFSSTYAMNKKKIMSEVDTYSLTEKAIFDPNKTADMIVQRSLNSKYKNDMTTYGNLIGDRLVNKNQVLIKQKPAAPEIKKKVVSPLTHINPSFSDNNILDYSHVSSVKSFTRPKSMERLKRKPNTNNKKAKQSKSKPRKNKTKRRGELVLIKL